VTKTMVLLMLQHFDTVGWKTDLSSKDPALQSLTILFVRRLRYPT